MTSHDDFAVAKPIAKKLRRMYAGAHSRPNRKKNSHYWKATVQAGQWPRPGRTRVPRDAKDPGRVEIEFSGQARPPTAANGLSIVTDAQ